MVPYLIDSIYSPAFSKYQTKSIPIAFCQMVVHQGNWTTIWLTFVTCQTVGISIRLYLNNLVNKFKDATTEWSDYDRETTATFEEPPKMMQDRYQPTR